MDVTNNNGGGELNKRRKKRDVSPMMYGKVPPQAKDLEEAILGAIMMERDVFDLVIQIISKAECFYVDAHQRIFRSFQALKQKYEPIDILTVVEELKSREELDMVGGPYAITKLTNTVVSTANVEAHARIILQKFLQREVIRICGESIADAYEDSIEVFDLMDKCRLQFDDLDALVSSTGNSSLAVISMRTLSKTIHRAESVNPIYTGIEAWDKLNGELFPGGIYVVAARPGMGKTAFAIQIIRNTTKKFRVGLINVEMTDEQVCTRYACNYGDIDNNILKLPKKEIPEDIAWKFTEGVNAFSEQMLEISSDESDIDRIVSKMFYWVRKLGCRLIMIDFLQILSVNQELAKYMTDVQSLNYILSHLRKAAKRLQVPIILFSQLNRELYKRGGNKEPGLSDLKGSGMIEEVAFQIAFLHRPEYYGILEEDFGGSTKGLCLLNVLKHRDGSLDRIKQKFIAYCSKFMDWESDYIPWIPSGGTSQKDYRSAAAGEYVDNEDFTDGMEEDVPF